jgi:hypothetical protein
MNPRQKIRGKRSTAICNEESTCKILMIRFKDPAVYRQLAEMCAANGVSMNACVEKLIIETIKFETDVTDVSYTVEQNLYLAVSEERRTPDASSTGFNQG